MCCVIPYELSLALAWTWPHQSPAWRPPAAHSWGRPRRWRCGPASPWAAPSGSPRSEPGLGPRSRRLNLSAWDFCNFPLVLDAVLFQYNQFLWEFRMYVCIHILHSTILKFTRIPRFRKHPLVVFVHGVSGSLASDIILSEAVVLTLEAPHHRESSWLDLGQVSCNPSRANGLLMSKKWKSKKS